MDGGAAFIILNPRNLNGHATIPDPALSRSKWSVNSCEETSEKCNRPPSIDLEWENDGKVYQNTVSIRKIITACFQRILTRLKLKSTMTTTRKNVIWTLVQYLPQFLVTKVQELQVMFLFRVWTGILRYKFDPECAKKSDKYCRNEK